MSSLSGYTEIVLEGESAKTVNALLQSAIAEASKEENDYCSEIIAVGGKEYRFAYGLKYIYKDSPDDNEFAPREVIGVEPILDHFALYICPFDDNDRTFTFEGKTSFDYDGELLRITESTYADVGAMLPFLNAILGEGCDELFYWISNEADYIGETNDVNHKYFDPEADMDALISEMTDYE